MGPDGVVDEAALLNGLGFLHQRQREAMRAGPDAADQLIDIVSLSMGYYHESDLSGQAYDNQLRRAVQDLGNAGILVVAAAGNNATSRPMLPAAFTPFRAGTLTGNGSAIPMLSVGALNPDGSVALFSNDGDWISCHGPGAALVSTLPEADVGQRAGVDLGVGPLADRPVASWRASIDPDSFTGFGTWSGTSFAAPVVAGAAAQGMLDRGDLGDPTVDRAAATREVLRALGFALDSP